MKRTAKLAAKLGVGALAAGALVVSPGEPERRRRVAVDSASVSPKPNVLFILTDDQPFHTLYQMPLVGAELISKGIDFTPKGYVIAPVCAAARLSLFTGLAPHTYGVPRDSGESYYYKLYRSQGYAQRDLLARMKALGYKTGFFGKVINGYGQVDAGKWVHPYVDRWVTLAGGQGKNPYTVNSDGNLREETENHTPFFGAKAEEFIRSEANSEASEASQPWFSWLNWTDPHAPYTPPPSHAHDYDGARYVSPAVGETDLSDKSSWMKKNLDYEGAAAQQKEYEGILEELVGVDAWVSRLLLALDETGQLENTIVIFSTDNGYFVGEHGGLTNKQAPYEEASRIPFVVRGPGFGSSAGVASEAFASHLDIPATIIEAGGGDPSDLDGRPLLSQAKRKRVLIEMPDPGWYMLREGNYAYIEFPNGEVEMYDLAADPYQLESFHDASLEASFSASLAALKAGKAESLRAAETA